MEAPLEIRCHLNRLEDYLRPASVRIGEGRSALE
jgi:hypothetical protein